MTPFSGVDYYAVDDLLTDEERMIRKTVRDFVEREAVPIIEGCHAREEFPRQLIPRMAELGFFGANLKGYGCAGLNNISYGLICQELERGDSGLRSMVSVQGSLCMHPIHAFGSEAQKQRWLPPMAAGNGHRLLRPHRARPRLRSRRHGDPRPRRWRPLHHLRHEALDHQRQHRRRRHRLGEDHRGHSRLSRREGHAGLQRPRHQGQVLAARLDHLGAGARRGARAARQHAARRRAA